MKTTQPHPAMLWEAVEDQPGAVRCKLCAHGCLIRPGSRGVCLVRENVDGALYSLVYGRVVSANVDPIEKKTPLPLLSWQRFLFHRHSRLQL